MTPMRGDHPLLRRPRWWVRHPLVVPLTLLACMVALVLVTKPDQSHWWSIHMTILGGFATGTVSLYLTVQHEVWRLIWGGRTITQIEADVHDHVRTLEGKVERMQRTPTMVAELARMREADGRR